MSPGTPERLLALLFAALLVAGFTYAAERTTHPQKSASPEPHAEHWRDEDSQRSETLRKAQDEIRRDPSQKKFILFRYGLQEQDLH
jgi:hypothetical protein